MQRGLRSVGVAMSAWMAVSALTPAMAQDGLPAPAAIPGPPRDRAQIIFFRPDTTRVHYCSVYAGEERIAPLRSRQYFIVNVSPGRTLLGQNEDLAVDTRAGQTRYVRCDVLSSGPVYGGGADSLELSTAEAFEKERSGLSYIDDRRRGPRVLPDPAATP